LLIAVGRLSVQGEWHKTTPRRFIKLPRGFCLFAYLGELLIALRHYETIVNATSLEDDAAMGAISPPRLVA
jgi:hypothetical protein